ncbi:MAG: FecR domain-containing protein [Deltaproteobacteria bacterium]|nr:FecR domain-containing protein [Deltaproteobacteria bacterium]
MKSSIVAVLLIGLVAIFACTAEEAKKAPAGPEAAKPAVQAVSQPPVVTAAFAVVRESAGGVKFRRGAETAPAPAGTALQGEDAVICEKDGSAAIEFQTGTVLKIGPGAFVRLGDVEMAGAKTQEIGLVMGRIWLTVAKLAGGLRLEVTTPTAVAGVRGTQFHVAAAADGSTRVGVEDGVVEVRTRTASRTVEKQREVVVEAGRIDAAPENLKLADWDQWLSQKKAEVLKDPVRVAAAFSEAIGAAGGASREKLEKAEAAYTALEKAEDPERDGRKAAFSEAIEQVRAVQNAAEVQMEYLGQLMKELAAEPGVAKSARDAVEAEVKKARERVMAPAENVKKAKELDAKAKPGHAGPAYAPVPGAPSAGKVAPIPRDDLHTARPAAAGREVPEMVRRNAVSARVEGLGRMAAHASEAVGDMKGDEKKVASLVLQPPAEETAAPKPSAKPLSLAEYERMFKENQAKLDGISGQGDIFDGKTRAGMVRAEAKKISAMLPGLRALAADLERQAREAREANEGRSLLQQGQKVRLFIKECESKVLWCDQQAAHYEGMKAE